MAAALALIGGLFKAFLSWAGEVFDWLHAHVPGAVWQALAIALFGTVLGWQACYVHFNVPQLNHDAGAWQAEQKAGQTAQQQQAKNRLRTDQVDGENQKRREDREAQSREIMKGVNDAPETHGLSLNPVLRAYADGLRKSAAAGAAGHALPAPAEPTR